MIIEIFKFIFYQPLYNTLVFITTNLPGDDLGWAIIILTIIIRFLLYPLYHHTLVMQKRLKTIEPNLKDIKEKHKNNKQEQTKQIFALYREHGINPFTGFMVLLIQLPIVLSLFYVFRSSVEIHPDLLYSFIAAPDQVEHLFLGLIDLTQRYWPLAVIVGLTQFFQMKLAIPPLPPKTNTDQPSFKEDLIKSMNIQMRYVMPLMIIFIAGALPSAISLYWLTSNLFSIGHELLVKRKALALKGSA